LQLLFFKAEKMARARAREGEFRCRLDAFHCLWRVIASIGMRFDRSVAISRAL
jgi:hypothetical protein